MPRFHTRYDCAPSTFRYTVEPTRTLSQFADECDVNKVIKRYGSLEAYETMLMATGKVRTQRPQYGDFTNIPDFLEAQNTVAKATQLFESLPSRVRDDFANDPAKFLAFAQDPKNFDKMVEYGLAQKKAEIASTGISDPMPATPVAEAEKLSTSEPNSESVSG